MLIFQKQKRAKTCGELLFFFFFITKRTQIISLISKLWIHVGILVNIWNLVKELAALSK